MCQIDNKFIRKCPKCNVEIIHANKYVLESSLHKNCRSCSKKGVKINNPKKTENARLEKLKIWQKECPQCKTDIFFKRKGDLKASLKNNSFCVKCRDIRRIEWNPDLGKNISKGKTGSIRLDMRGNNNPMKNELNRLRMSLKMKGDNNPSRKQDVWNKGLGIENLTDFELYFRYVTNFTYGNINQIPNYNKSKRGKAGIEGAYHVDHIISIRRGFREGILPAIIGDISNLQFIPWEENQARRELHKKY